MSEPPQPAADLERFRHYLELLARLQLGPHPRARLDASDLVQQTLIDAHAQLDRFRGTSEAELAGWLKRMLACNLADAHRAARRQKRDVARELSLDQALDQALDESCSRLGACLEAAQTSPSGQAARNEELVRLAAALEGLPPAQREAVVLHHLQGLTLAETATALGRSEPAVAGLLRRGLRRLREVLDAPDSS